MSEAEQAAALADRLLQAHARLRGLDAPPEVRARLARRLIAVSDASKHDVPRAAARLERWLDDVDAGRLPQE